MTPFFQTYYPMDTTVDKRDRFLGQCRYVICRYHGRGSLKHGHIIMESHPDTWDNFKRRGWIPGQAKAAPRHEPRDGMLMCKNHHGQFGAYAFFIRFFPEVRLIRVWFGPSISSKQIRKFVFINYSEDPDLHQFHDKATALDIKDKYAPFPSTFIIHEMRARGFYPFQPVVPTVPDDIPW
ncbi:hypothetical protein BDN67DRAFT_1015527 [Paxillus ammoniavirescens]|nr:hypothetical protein BDN67DRAFT_1015527 [Paxillus ammoniavirescens]